MLSFDVLNRFLSWTRASGCFWETTSKVVLDFGNLYDSSRGRELVAPALNPATGNARTLALSMCYKLASRRGSLSTENKT